MTDGSDSIEVSWKQPDFVDDNDTGSQPMRNPFKDTEVSDNDKKLKKLIVYNSQQQVNKTPKISDIPNVKEDKSA